MNNESDYSVVKCPRFVHKAPAMALGRTLTLAGGALAAVMFWSLPGERKLWLYITALVFGILCTIVFLVGLITLLTGAESIHISREEVRLCLGSITLRRVPIAGLRSVVASVREVRLGMHKGDMDLYLLSINPKRGFPIWMERVNPAVERFKELLPNQVDLI
ncbi:MAG TPA: hypothetical protein IAC31_03595 [Candidatus Faecousia intestinigallinarum]|nr:hypothetical protein [Candidatus Faecousia intestinigallinarum]